MEPRFYRLTMLTMRACACKWKKHIICPIHCNTCTNPILLCCHDSAMDIRLRPSNPQKYCYTGRKEDHSTRMKKKRKRSNKNPRAQTAGALAILQDLGSQGQFGVGMSWHCFAWSAWTWHLILSKQFDIYLSCSWLTIWQPVSMVRRFALNFWHFDLRIVKEEIMASKAGFDWLPATKVLAPVGTNILYRHLSLPWFFSLWTPGANKQNQLALLRRESLTYLYLPLMIDGQRVHLYICFRFFDVYLFRSLLRIIYFEDVLYFPF